MKNMKKKGFTLVELLVVIAIIAILAVVSVVGYTVFIDRANQSADQQAVTQINTMLEALDVNNEPEDIVALWAYLNETGLTAEDYKPLSKDHIFVWDKELNRVLLVKDNKVVYPEDYAETAKSNNWFNLKADEIKLEAAPTIDANGAVTVDSPSDLITSFKNASAISNMTLSSDVNLMGANTFIPEVKSDLVIDGNNKTVYNLVSTEYATIGKASQKDPSSENQAYASGFIGKATVAKGEKLTIKNITFDGLTIGDYDTAITGIIVGSLQGELVLENVTIKNCTVYGQNKVGIIAGYLTGNAKITLKNVKIENCTVNTSEGEAGKVFGVVGPNATVSVEGCTVTDTVINTVAHGNHQNVTINGVKYTTKVDGNGNTDIKTTTIINKKGETEIVVKNGEDGKSYTAVCQTAGADTLAWFYPAEHGYEKLDDTYCGRPAQEKTTIESLNKSAS